jgi:hypothetical protein
MEAAGLRLSPVTGPSFIVPEAYRIYPEHWSRRNVYVNERNGDRLMEQARGSDQVRVLVLKVFISGYVTRTLEVKVNLSLYFIAYNAITAYAGVKALSILNFDGGE